MTGVERVILIGCLLQGALGGEWAVWMPKHIEALSGSCVWIPCRFEILQQWDKELISCRYSVIGQWFRDGAKVFDSRNYITSHLKGKITGDLLQKNCTTVLEKVPMTSSGQYNFRLECSKLKWTFKQMVELNIKDSPPKPKLTLDKVEVMEGTNVSLNCSAAAPCPDLPPDLTWTPRLGDSVYQLQVNENQTQSVSSVMTFTASHLHHGQKITCRAQYTLQQEDAQRTSEASQTLEVFYPPKNTSASISPSGSVFPGHSVTLTCSSKANPPVQIYTWYKVNGAESNTLGTGQNLTFNVTESSDGEQYYCEAQNKHGMRNSTTVQLSIIYPPKNTSASVSPSGSVFPGHSVTLTCSSKANPPVKNFTWYKVNGAEMNIIGTGQNLTFNVTESSDGEQYFCEAQNKHGMRNSATVQLSIIYRPQISGSGSCSRTAAQISCSCESRGNPSPSIDWCVSGLQVTNSTDRVIREEQLGSTGLRSSLTMYHSQGDTPNILCLSTNTLGSSSLQLHIPSPQLLLDFNITSLLIGAAAGAGAMMMMCLIMQLILKKKRDNRCSGSTKKDTEGLKLSDETATQGDEATYANRTTLSGVSTVEKLAHAPHYAAVDFSKLRNTGGEQGPGIIRGMSKRSDYAVIRHKSVEEDGGGEEEGEVAQGEVEKEDQNTLGAETEMAREMGLKKGALEGEFQPNLSQQVSVSPEPSEETTYGNISRSRPTKRAPQGQEQPHRSPAAEEKNMEVEQNLENSAGGQEDMYVDVMSPVTEGDGMGTEEGEYAEVGSPLLLCESVSSSHTSSPTHLSRNLADLFRLLCALYLSFCQAVSSYH
ncbi:hypothetical protein GJAV_G00004370 [Gymnothorax javanicus]|nr:hypothetical protein GJAV_G00004370 [Gymnothorax javanicus]